MNRKVASQLTCPRCKSHYLTKAGRMWVRGARRQRYQCQDCGKYHIPGSRAKKDNLQGGKG